MLHSYIADKIKKDTGPLSSTYSITLLCWSKGRQKSLWVGCQLPHTRGNIPSWLQYCNMGHVLLEKGRLCDTTPLRTIVKRYHHNEWQKSNSTCSTWRTVLYAIESMLQKHEPHCIVGFLVWQCLCHWTYKRLHCYMIIVSVILNLYMLENNV